jgi:acyl dehydratase
MSAKTPDTSGIASAPASGASKPIPKIWFEDFQPGHVAEYGPRIVTREDIIAFARQFDPQPMHLDDAAARQTLLGALSASGWHTCALVMRIIADGFILDSSSMGSMGIDEVRWTAPVHAGDALSVRATVLETRVSRSRPEMGIVSMFFEVFAENGETRRKVMTQKNPILMARRNPGGPA